ncbi:hypothetical protein A3D78_00155 [Candidatus Gottesmanbacteria bacterium RIFCSPHIGHO2_02_FULL_39_14]|uniref:Uncharacterized protein n=2 Tax=Candidatus Gottesmaniibacteriota TaxID=1752720 RepID=A0A1F5ZXF1_9BACT|nr:MAG: hypothetical protein A2153_02395 [Candidatus Gottesmanbacteria bacterium RBG_16_38_7b]OGG17043.1 MAG: hypothetical protein A3D78_00155 [Candidatus Gottesmanbacteria bacterium RIFCSPHIGHO2_02_FULL_39_14]
MTEEKHDEAAITGDLAGNKLIWIAGAIILLIAGWFGLKAIFASMESYRLTLVNAPKEVNASSVATFTWRIDGSPTTINHTSVHLGTTSQTGELGKDVKPENTPYNLAVPDFLNGNYSIPLQFIGNITMTNSGIYYYRVHALIKDKNYWSDEYSLEVKIPEYKVTLQDAPPQVTENQTFAFTWRVDGLSTTINHTSVHYGTQSTPGTLSKTVKPEDTNYTDLIKDFAKGNYTIPLQFVGNTTIAKSGTYYIRGHAIINGENYWTDERTLEVISAKEAVVTPTPESEETEPSPTVQPSP